MSFDPDEKQNPIRTILALGRHYNEITEEYEYKPILVDEGGNVQTIGEENE